MLHPLRKYPEGTARSGPAPGFIHYNAELPFLIASFDAGRVGNQYFSIFCNAAQDNKMSAVCKMPF